MRVAWNKTELDEEAISRMYLIEKMTAKEIAEKLDIGVGIIYTRLRLLKIIRTNSESHIGKRPSNYRGWYIEKRSGYKVVMIPSNSPYASMAVMNRSSGAIYVREHRLVMAEKLKRPLESWEIVHHINHDKLDNRIDNLQLVAGQSNHNGETITHNILMKLKRENEIMLCIINQCPACRAALMTTIR